MGSNLFRWMNCFLGIWLLFAPLLFWAPTNTYIVAAVVITFSIVSFPEVGRPFRWVLSLLGIWLVIGSLFLPGASILARWNGVFFELLIFVLSTIWGPIRHSYGTYDRLILWTPRRRALIRSEKSLRCSLAIAMTSTKTDLCMASGPKMYTRRPAF
jgi:hypothetical protein